jgi:hypothetical protein
MPQVKHAAQLSGTPVRAQGIDAPAGSATAAVATSSSNGAVGGKKTSSVGNVSSGKELQRISPGLKTLAATTLATNVAQQKALLTKKPEGIQISRSKHWKFISSYHGPYISPRRPPISFVMFLIPTDGYNSRPSC